MKECNMIAWNFVPHQIISTALQEMILLSRPFGRLFCLGQLLAITRHDSAGVGPGLVMRKERYS